ncbi:hypothetical protein C8F04DRAFT_1269661 [Mycena alexandri]|uniref:Uncharacterized protein n=1 Tax=Mycena alexandri TaxID=1745969 RepID=A0AAD6SC01_9AGAR|nr:hypothetical protein C8F04DRAFT_1269661 [Mycena alexandri]
MASAWPVIEEEPLTPSERAAEQRELIRIRLTDPMFVTQSLRQHEGRKGQGPEKCAWCRSTTEPHLYRCRDRNCRGGLPGCATCIAVVHEKKPEHWLEEWCENRYWKLVALADVGYVYQRGHDGNACPNPAEDTSVEVVQTRFGEAKIFGTMPASAAQRCVDEEERKLRRKATYRKYRRTHLDDRREKGRRRMAALRARQTDEQRVARLARHREAQKKYREEYREQIAHRARRAAVRKNAAAGKETQLRPKARQYWSDPELMTEEEDEDEGDDW